MSPDAVAGSEGSETILDCQVHRRGFGPGPNEITISTAGDELTFAFPLGEPEGDPVERWFVIGPDLQVREVNVSELPSSPAECLQYFG